MKKLLATVIFFACCFNLEAQCWESVSAGGYHNMASKADGSIAVWGWNNYGQLGIGAGYDNIHPLPLADILGTGWKMIGQGDYHNEGIKNDGTLWAWGSYGSGICSSCIVWAPQQVGTDNNWKWAVAGYSHSLGIRTDGTLWAWGSNISGEIGDGTSIERVFPVQIGNATDWAGVAAGFYSSFAIKNNGTLWAWGYNLNGALGDGTTVNRNVPVQVGNATDWAVVSSRLNHTLAVKTNGTLWAWGTNDHGQLGDGSRIDQNAPIQIGTGNNWKSVSAGGHSSAIKTDSTIWCWGENLFGAVGNNSTVDVLAPYQVLPGTKWRMVSAGRALTIALRADGNIFSWGINSEGELGDGTTIQRLAPVQVTCNPIPLHPLPLKLLAFDVIGLGSNKTRLSWKTSSEINTKCFEIQRSNDGILFNSIKSIQASGNSNAIIEYSFIDLLTPAGINYYRLKIMDIDGSFTYSDIKIIKPDESNKITVYPNPLTNLVNIEGNFKGDDITIWITDVTGRKLYQCVKRNAPRLQLITTGLKPGVYFLFITDASARFCTKITRQ